jgi:hypothetical protein
MRNKRRVPSTFASTGHRPRWSDCVLS